MAQVKSVDEPLEDVLIEGMTHKVMVLFNLPAGWPFWVMPIVVLLLSALASWPWFLLLNHVQATWTIGLIHAVFVASDMIIFYLLPKRKLSFGPWQSQAIALAIPRAIATAVLVLLTQPFGWIIAGIIVIVVQTLGSLALLWGIYETTCLKMTEFYAFSDRLAPGTQPIRIMHISDLHVERLTNREKKVVDLVNQAKPDLILISGDYVNLSYNEDPETISQVKSLLRQLRAPFGVYATLGSPPVDRIENVAPLFSDLHITLLRHQWEVVEMGNGRNLIIMGMDCTHHLPTDQARFARLMADVPNGAPHVLLYHSPELMPQAVAEGIDLYLCGHTHGGQVRLPLFGPIVTSSQLGRRYVMGPYKNGRTALYVSRGVGLEGLSAPRVRFLATPEITLVTLNPKGEAVG